MGEITGIAWTHHTFNPWIGCTKKHAGCDHCYAEKLATTRLSRAWGPGAPRQVTADANWKQPLRWARAAAQAGERRRVFCASLADVLDEEAPAEAQQRLWQLIRETAIIGVTGRPLHGDGIDYTDCLGSGPTRRPGLDWLLLTKRPERWELVPEDVRPLVWLGTSISDQATADEWCRRLLLARGFRLRFLSVEPLVGRIDLSRALTAWAVRGPTHVEAAGHIDWVIVGGESGPGARPCATEWIRSVVDQCAIAGVPCFVKQLGAHPTASYYDDSWRELSELQGWEWPDPIGWSDVDGQPGMDARVSLRSTDKKGGDPAEWPEDLRVRQFPEARRG